MNKGKLFLIPSLLAECDVHDVLPNKTLAVISNIEYFIVEENEVQGDFYCAPESKKIDDLSIFEYNEHTAGAEAENYIQLAIQGHHLGLLSEAGTPCVADPGSAIVKLAHQNNITVVPLSGPSSILLALMASGFNGQNFVFHGYLPKEAHNRLKKIKELERNSSTINQTQIFIETPYRNTQVFETLTNNCRQDTLLCIASGLTGPDEYICSKTIGEWRDSKPDIHKKPTIFLLSAGPFTEYPCNKSFNKASKTVKTSY